MHITVSPHHWVMSLHSTLHCHYYDCSRLIEGTDHIIITVYVSNDVSAVTKIPDVER